MSSHHRADRLTDFEEDDMLINDLAFASLGLVTAAYHPASASFQVSQEISGI